MFAIPCSAKETPPLQDSAIQPEFSDLYSGTSEFFPKIRPSMPSGITFQQGLLEALLGHRNPSIETSGSWEIMDIYSKTRRKLWYRRVSQERTSERRKTGRSSFFKNPCQKSWRKTVLCKDTKQRTAWAGTKQPRATGSDGRIPDSSAQEDTCPFHIT